MESEKNYGLTIFDSNKLQIDNHDDYILKYPENISVSK